jgi:hypothetical protein
VIGPEGFLFWPAVFQIIALASGHRVGRNLLLGSDDLSPHKRAKIANAAAANALGNPPRRNRIGSLQCPDRHTQNCRRDWIGSDRVVGQPVELIKDWLVAR